MSRTVFSSAVILNVPIARRVFLFKVIFSTVPWLEKFLLQGDVLDVSMARTVFLFNVIFSTCPWLEQLFLFKVIFLRCPWLKQLFLVCIENLIP